MTIAKIKKLRPVIKCHGGKFYLANWVIENFPENYEEYDYIEPFIGGGSVLFNKNRCVGNRIEALNDLHLGLVQIYRALRDEPKHFINRLKRTRYTDRVFKRELRKQELQFPDYMDQAVNEFIVRRMSRGGLKKAFAWSNRLRGGQPGDLNAWKTILEQLPSMAKRIEDASIFNKSGDQVIRAFNDEQCLCYCDPPYLHDTRISKQTYDNEMTTDDHIALAEALKAFKGKALISGYSSILYKRLYADWRCVKKKIANHSSQQKTKQYKTECLWMNY